jgi:hypothetical protein
MVIPVVGFLKTRLGWCFRALCVNFFKNKCNYSGRYILMTDHFTTLFSVFFLRMCEKEKRERGKMGNIPLS